MLVKDANSVSPPRRLDLSCLKPDINEQPNDIPKMLIRSGSLTEQREMEKLLRDTNGHANLAPYDPPAVLVIRSMK